MFYFSTYYEQLISPFKYNSKSSSFCSFLTKLAAYIGVASVKATVFYPFVDNSNYFQFWINLPL